jgi:hypothetical protein
MLVADLMSLLCLVSLGFVDPRAIAQEVVGQAPQRIAMDPTVLTVEQEKALASKPGSDFKECANGCPEMIVIPAGKFIMGSPENELDRNASEGPPHEVTIAKPFALSKFEVTFEEWDACVAAAACPRVPDRWGRERMPVINVSWVDIKQYVSWLSQLTGREYRLPTEAEWEYAARAAGAMILVWATPTAMDAAVNGISNKRRPLDRLNRIGRGCTTCMAMSGSGLRIAGTRTTTLHQLTDQRGSGAVIIASGSSAAVPGATRASSSAPPSASGAMPMSGLKRLASG